jgi:hypothetical protein
MHILSRLSKEPNYEANGFSLKRAPKESDGQEL